MQNNTGIMNRYIIFEETLSNVILSICCFITLTFLHYLSGEVNIVIPMLASLFVFSLLTIGDFSKRYIDNNY